MNRLMAAKPLPRGERIAKFYEHLPSKTRHYVPLWCRLVEKGCIGAVDARFNRKGTDTAAAWRVYAAPLRKAREDRLKWREVGLNAAKVILKLLRSDSGDNP